MRTRKSRKTKLRTLTDDLTETSIEILNLLALRPDITKYEVAHGSKREKRKGLNLGISTVDLNVKRLEDAGLIKTSSKKEYRGHIRKTYRLTMYGLVIYFGILCDEAIKEIASGKRITKTKISNLSKVIQNYKETHVILKHWKTLQDWIAPQGVFKHDEREILFFSILAITTLNQIYSESTTFSWKQRKIRFFQNPKLPDEKQIKRAFGYAFMEVWRFLNIKEAVKPIREIYDYIEPIVYSKKLFQDSMEKALEQFNPRSIEK